ncbi:hypothetical protein PGTUg99_034444 [Puccinia graminis f. sp. tritici]|uniref:Uncharacterized protein n=1 Tax=Puccinia graminis f. sp. tritici TaxID=56615 RepID=A0A5B0SMK6_PUCGR|nr:hypothetical protein PGTUg99_034444 [Puccinia graminis f. sp. tritici]
MALQSRFFLVSLFAVVAGIFYGSNGTVELRKDHGKATPSLEIKFDDGHNGLYQSMMVFEPSVLTLSNWSAIPELAIKLEAESELRNGPAIAKMWNQLSNGLSKVMHSAQELNARGKWDLHLLSSQLKVLCHRKHFSEPELKSLIRKIFTCLSTMLNSLEDLEALIIQTTQIKASVYSTLYTTEKHLRLDLEEGGLTRWLILHFRGNRAILRRQTELSLTQLAIGYATEASEFLSKIETKVKSCKANIMPVRRAKSAGERLTLVAVKLAGFTESAPLPSSISFFILQTEIQFLINISRF